MKIDRVIFCLNNNPVYTGLWNPISRAWKLKWGITPTLMFVGTEDELKSHDLSKEYGEIVRLNPVPEVVVNPSLDWSATWALFYGASLFPNEVVTLMGLDQLLLSDTFLKEIATNDKITHDAYIVSLADAYKDLPGIFPSAWHIAKGETFKKIYSIEETWEAEVKKVFSQREKYPRLIPYKWWGLDEAYSSEVIRTKISEYPILMYNMFHSYWYPSRLDRGGRLEYSVTDLRNGRYSEAHLPRPFENHKEYIDQLIHDLL